MIALREENKDLKKVKNEGLVGEKELEAKNLPD